MPLTDDPWIPLDGSGRPLAWQRAPAVRVYRFDGEASFAELPNVECLEIGQEEGTDHGQAQFRYNLTTGLPGAPSSFEEALGTDFVGALVVDAGDRLVVRAERPDGAVENLFDGLALQFGVDLDPDSEEALFGAVGIAKRCWDDVIGGAIIRDGSKPSKVKDTRTDVPAHFNPDGRPNCIPDGAMAGTQSDDGDFRYPTFVERVIVNRKDDSTMWTLPKAVRYILNNANPSQKYVKNPDGQYLDDLLVSPPARGDGPIDPEPLPGGTATQNGRESDPAAADRSRPISCPDTPITGRDWPGVIYKLIAECGFGMNFGLNRVGLPVTGLNLFAHQAGALKKLYLAPVGTAFDPTLFNFADATLARDVTDVVNRVVVKGGLTRWEADFILSPGFPMAAGDKDASVLKTYDRGDPAFRDDKQDHYRLFVFDETGVGHYAAGTNTKLSTVPSLDALLGKDLYARRARPGIGDLVTRDDKGKAREAMLWISLDYAGAEPGLWDGTGTWQPVTTSTWRLLHDRLGIEITDSNPNIWEIGESSESGAPYPAGVVKVVEAMAAAGASNFTFRLTCVVEGDIAMTRIAGPLGNSPVPYPVTRRVDASDRFRLEVVGHPSTFNTTSSDKAVRDDGDLALAEAQAIRANSELGVLSGSVVIPRLTTYYAIGDRISEVEGRYLGLRTDKGAGEDAVYPVVIGRRFILGPDSHATILELSDAGTLRSRYKRAPGSRGPQRPANAVGRSRGNYRGSVGRSGGNRGAT